MRNLRRTTTAAATAIAVTIAVSCSGDAEPNVELNQPSTLPTPNSDATVPETDTASNPVVAWQPGSDSNMDALFTGWVVVEDDCIALDSGDEQPLLIVWPIGTTWEPESSTVVLPDGTSIVNGDRIETGGGAIPTVQVLGEVGDWLSDEATAHLAQCSERYADGQLMLMDYNGTVRLLE